MISRNPEDPIHAIKSVISVAISSLSLGETPRLEGPDEAHIARLTEIDTPLPPILVDRASMRVIDGMHRLMAAMRKGCQTIDVEFFDGTEADAFLRAVKANVSHGFPLSLADRRAAAVRIIESHPHMSDRAIAQTAGLGRTTVAAIRESSVGQVAQFATRLGSDGKVRPLNGADGRRRAAMLIAERPDASLREVARGAGISLATASDVRKRLARGEDPVAPRIARADSREGADVKGGQQARQRAWVVELDPEPVIEKLLRDPTLRQREGGRKLLRLLRHNAAGVAELSALLSSVPPHWNTLIANLAEQYAQFWREFSQELDDRSRESYEDAVAD